MHAVPVIVNTNMHQCSIIRIPKELETAM